jgi:predicted DNA-binding transcriptional regulator YafY
MPEPASPEPAARLAALAQALVEGRVVRITYDSPRGGASERDVAVLALAFRGGAWIAACHCSLRGALRAFRVDRVRSATLGGPAPEYRGPFDSRAFAAGTLDASPWAPALHVAIRVEPPLARFAGALLPGLAEVVDDGARVVHLWTSRPEKALAVALSLGDAAAIVFPPELARVARRLRDRIRVPLPF